MSWVSGLLAIARLLLSGLGLFLSLWIVLPAPIFALLPLSVGAPEVSPWLLSLNLLLAGFGLLGVIARRRPAPESKPESQLESQPESRLEPRPRLRLSSARIPLGMSSLAIALSLWPLIQLPLAHQNADRAIATLIGPETASISTSQFQNPPSQRPPSQRQHPWSSRTSFQGITIPEVRYAPDIRFAQPDGIPLRLDLYRPLASEPTTPYPSLVVIYGGAWQRGSPKNDEKFSRYMAAQGYAVWAIAYRHAPRYRFPAQFDDVQAALSFIQTHAAAYNADPNRIALIGRSAGAQLAMLAAYQPNQPAIRGVISYYGPVNLTRGYYEIPTPDPINSRRTLTAFLGGSPDQFPDLYRQASPYNQVRPADTPPGPLPPTLLIYGGKDHIVRSAYGQALRDRLQATNNPVAFIEIPWADHAFDAVFNGPSNQMALYYTERFLAWALR